MSMTNFDMTETQESAFDVIRRLLQDYGLEELTDFVGNFIVQTDTINKDMLTAEIRRQPAYQQRFAANEERRRAGLPVLSEDTYIAMEKTYAQYMRAAGLPAGFYDSNDDFRELIRNNVSVAELQARVEQGYSAVRNADPEVVRQMQDLYGVSEGELAAFFIDPDRARDTVLQRARAAEVAAGAAMAGGAFSREEAERLAREGITLEEARTGTAAIEQLQEVFQPTVGGGDERFTREEQVGAVFGTDPRAAQRLRQQQRRRQAQFEAGGGFAGQGAEMTGLQ